MELPNGKLYVHRIDNNVYHSPTCFCASIIKQENREYLSQEEVDARGSFFKPCSRCITIYKGYLANLAKNVNIVKDNTVNQSTILTESYNNETTVIELVGVVEGGESVESAEPAESAELAEPAETSISKESQLKVEAAKNNAEASTINNDKSKKRVFTGFGELRSYLEENPIDYDDPSESTNTQNDSDDYLDPNLSEVIYSNTDINGKTPSKSNRIYDPSVSNIALLGRQVIKLCNKYDLYCHIIDETAYILTSAGSWKFRYDERPITLYHLNSKSMHGGKKNIDYHIQGSDLYSPLEVIVFIIKHDSAVINKTLNELKDISSME